MSNQTPAAPHPPLRRRATLSGLEKLKVSVVLIVKDGERHLDRVLSGVGFCDELLVLDSGSSDRTREICAAHNARVVQQPFAGFGVQRRRAVDLAKHDWVLVVDDDEILDYEAATTIQVLDYVDPQRAWRIPRRTYVGARELRFGEWAADQPVRLFNRTRIQYDDQPIDETVVIPTDANVQTLQGALHHYRFVDHAELFESIIRRTRARVAVAEHAWPRLGLLPALVRAAWAFLRSFVVRQGFRDGVAGLLVAMAVALDAILGPILVHERDGAHTG